MVQAIFVQWSYRKCLSFSKILNFRGIQCDKVTLKRNCPVIFKIGRVKFRIFRIIRSIFKIVRSVLKQRKYNKNCLLLLLIKRRHIFRHLVLRVPISQPEILNFETGEIIQNQAWVFSADQTISQNFFLVISGFIIGFHRFLVSCRKIGKLICWGKVFLANPGHLIYFWSQGPSIISEASNVVFWTFFRAKLAVLFVTPIVSAMVKQIWREKVWKTTFHSTFDMIQL